METIPFSPPYIDDDIEKEVLECLRSGWITTGPKVRDLENLISEIAKVEKAICVNSWTSGANLVLKWLGIGPGDEVIVPAYTYSATALTIINSGAKVVMVDVLSDFTIDPQKIREAITPATKAIFAVDIAGLPCDYDNINDILKSEDVIKVFSPSNAIQEKFRRPVLISDAAHSLGALYNNNPSATSADVTIFSLHAVKNITTAEGGVICLNLPKPFSNEEIYKWMKLNSLNGQTKDAFSKTQGGGWRYDIVSPGLKINMPDVCAAIGLAQLRKYQKDLLPKRKDIHYQYNQFFSEKPWAILPTDTDTKRESSYHLYALRIKDITEEQRDEIIDIITSKNVAVNVHFIPMPMLSLFRSLGYDINNYPNAYMLFKNEISLPIYPQMTNEMIERVADVVTEAVENIVK